MTTTTVLVAGATGMLGNRVAGHLLDQPDVAVRLLVRASGSGPGRSDASDSLTARGAVAVVGDVTDPASLDEATAGRTSSSQPCRVVPPSCSTVRPRPIELFTRADPLRLQSRHA